LKGLVGGGYGRILFGGMWHTWRATHVDFTCIYLAILLYLGIFLEGEVMETLLAIFGGAYFVI